MKTNGTLIELSFDNGDGFEDHFNPMEIWDDERAKESEGEHEDPYNGGFYSVRIIRKATSEDFKLYKDKTSNE